ncbi:putative transposase-like protein [Trichonephila clavipes]|nr:putative transposase-like protein [Trichonephila clavipes]
MNGKPVFLQLPSEKRILFEHYCNRMSFNCTPENEESVKDSIDSAKEEPESVLETLSAFTCLNHSLTFKNPETSAHTNSIEGTWSAIKRSLRNHAAHVEGEFDHYLAEYMWRRRRGHSLDDDVFREFLRAITTLYPPMEKDVPS